MGKRPADSPRSLRSLSGAPSFVSQLVARFPPEAEFDARSILKSHPRLSLDKSAIVDLAYEEYCRRADAGDSISPGEFAGRFPEVEATLLQALELYNQLGVGGHWRITPPSPDQVAVGDDFLGFSLLSELGHGAFSRVFLARELELGNRHVVLKVCGQDGDEAAHLGQLRHPHIVPIYSVRYDYATGLTAICMPYLGRATLPSVIKAASGRSGAAAGRQVILAAARQGLEGEPIEADEHPPHWAVQRGTYVEGMMELGAQLCDALAFAHEKGICHCDIKPSNVLLTSAGRAMLFDFNLSVQQGSGGERVVGTLPYMAPEQLQRLIALPGDGDSGAFEPVSDLYSLGVVLCEMLLGEYPFGTIDKDQPQRSAAADLLARQQDVSAVIARLERTVSAPAAQCIAAYLAFDPADRPASAAELGRGLRRFLSVQSRSLRWVRSHKLAACAAVLALTGLVASGAAWASLRPPLPMREYQTGYELLEQGKYLAAAPHFREAADADGGFAQALLASGWSLLLAAREPGVDGEESMSLARRALTYFEAYNDRVGDRAAAAGGEGSRVDAEAWRIRKQVAAASRAYCLSWIGENFPAAAHAYEDAIKLGLDNAAIRNNAGYCRLNTRMLDAAAKHLEEALRFDANLKPALRNLAILELKLAEMPRGDRTQGMFRAIAHIEGARKSGPISPEIEVDAAWIYAKAHRQYGMHFPDEFNDSQGSGMNREENSKYHDKVVHACRRAVVHGISADHLERVYQIWPELRRDVSGNDSVAEGATQPSKTQPRMLRPYLLDVYPTIRHSLIPPR